MCKAAWHEIPPVCVLVCEACGDLFLKGVSCMFSHAVALLAFSCATRRVNPAEGLAGGPAPAPRATGGATPSHFSPPENSQEKSSNKAFFSLEKGFVAFETAGFVVGGGHS